MGHTENINGKWRVHTANLLKESLVNRGMQIMVTPFNILKSILAELGERCSVINDCKLNELMGRLTIYGVCDPEDKENYNKDLSEKVLSGKTGIDVTKLKAENEALKQLMKKAAEHLYNCGYAEGTTTHKLMEQMFSTLKK